MPLFAFIACCSLLLSCSTFVIKCSWQIVYMLINFAWLLVVIHVPYDYAIVMHSFIFMRSYCWLHFHAMFCSVVSGSSSPTCLLIVISTMYESVILLAMFTWVPSYFLCLFGSWSVRDFCSMHLVVSCHAFFCHDLFL